ncbi:MAG: TrkH family potassium uptake protein [Alphaproteobacteria bacterium]|nr:TrkH family potassium uptake protein [Alphaproteobacteria bacterium]
MLDLRPVLFSVGVLSAILGLTMLIPAALDAADGNDDWQVFALSALLTLFVATAMMLATGLPPERGMRVRQAFLMTSLSWTLLAAFAALPFSFSGLELSYVDGYFEAVSGLTTTGSTVIVGLEKLPRGLLLWRAMLQWLGGVGIIVVGIAILPFLRVGGMQLFRAESSDRSEKALPRAAQVASAITTIYVTLTLACIAAYWAAGMNFFDAVCHAFATISTGGYANYDSSFAAFDSPLIEWICILFMLLGTVTFTLYVLAARGRPGALWSDAQVRMLLALVLLASLALAAWRLGGEADLGLHQALRSAFFSVVTVVSTTGFVTEDYSAWGGFAMLLFFILLFSGGCTGSTSGGVKLFRFAVLSGAMRRQFFRLTHPHAVHATTFNGVPVPDSVVSAVLGFFFLYGVTVFAVALGLGLLGLDFVTALSGAATAVGNVGPGLGPGIGPSGNFADLPDAAKVLLSFAMLLGRLELFTILVILTPEFWRA